MAGFYRLQARPCGCRVARDRNIYSYPFPYATRLHGTRGEDTRALCTGRRWPVARSQNLYWPIHIPLTPMMAGWVSCCSWNDAYRQNPTAASNGTAASSRREAYQPMHLPRFACSSAPEGSIVPSPAAGRRAGPRHYADAQFSCILWAERASAPCIRLHCHFRVAGGSRRMTEPVKPVRRGPAGPWLIHTAAAARATLMAVTGHRHSTSGAACV